MRRLLSIAVCFLAACDGSSAVKEPAANGPRPSPTSTATTDAGDKDCFDNPKTHFEIINACTSAQKIAKNPTLTKLLPDGGLPPLN